MKPTTNFPYLEEVSCCGCTHTLTYTRGRFVDIKFCPYCGTQIAHDILGLYTARLPHRHNLRLGPTGEEVYDIFEMPVVVVASWICDETSLPMARIITPEGHVIDVLEDNLWGVRIPARAFVRGTIPFGRLDLEEQHKHLTRLHIERIKGQDRERAEKSKLKQRSTSRSTSRSKTLKVLTPEEAKQKQTLDLLKSNPDLAAKLKVLLGLK